MNEPWTRQDYDTDKSFAAFCIYRDMGTGRGLEKLAQNWTETGQGLSWLKKWSSDHNWVERVRAYDDFVQGEAMKATLQQNIENAKLAAEYSKVVLETKLTDFYEVDGGVLMNILKTDIPEEKWLAVESVEGFKIKLKDKTAIAREVNKASGATADKVKHEITGKDGESIKIEINWTE